jgi:hypothetical protein
MGTIIIITPIVFIMTPILDMVAMGLGIITMDIVIIWVGIPCLFLCRMRKIFDNSLKIEIEPRTPTYR